MTIPSPCTKICKLDQRQTRCIGCGRTLNEIGRWTIMPDAERNAIMARLTR